MALDRVRVSDALKARDAGITTVLVVPREGVLPGQSVILNLSGDKAEAMALKQPAALHLHMSTLARQYPGSLMGTVAYARQALDDAIRYRDEWAAYEKSPSGKRRPRYDSALAAWQDALAGREMLIVTAFRENDIRRALALADEFKLRIVVGGVHARAGWGRGDPRRPGKPGGGQDRRRGGLVGGAVDQGCQGEDGLRRRPALRAGGSAVTVAVSVTIAVAQSGRWGRWGVWG